ncbi:MAG: hypothetical protein H7Z41_08445 [Cytophagales bacterium]|nr:hypothetical protein [Armatimonadota bacterium]
MGREEPTMVTITLEKLPKLLEIAAADAIITRNNIAIAYQKSAGRFRRPSRTRTISMVSDASR